MANELCGHGSQSAFVLTHDTANPDGFATFRVEDVHSSVYGALVVVEGTPEWADVAFELRHVVGSSVQPDSLLKEVFETTGSTIDVALKIGQGTYHIWQQEGGGVTHCVARAW